MDKLKTLCNCNETKVKNQKTVNIWIALQLDIKISGKGTDLPLCAIAFKHIINFIFIQGSDSLVYTSLCGTVGMLVPFTSNEDHDFFQHLEMHMRGENPPMCGRDHLSYRLV